MALHYRIDRVGIDEKVIVSDSPADCSFTALSWPLPIGLPTEVAATFSIDMVE